ncbi:MAG TPA: MFS transporter, partial [Synergistaceae bacterium]|nr:MFS transporter [Synergistaceae bacterium]
MLALFLGALDALVVAAAMPSIVADLGGIHLYSWVFSSYMLTRATALPIFGKLCDLYGSRNLFLAAVALFMASSVLAGAADSMPYLIFFRALQGIGAGGNFALAYVIAADLAPPHKRGKAMGSMAFVWGVASILGPSLGGFMVNYFSWRWIFYINLPLGAFAFLSIALFLKEVRQKKPNASVDYPGALVLTLSVLALLTAFLLGEHWDQWLSPTIPALLVASAAGVFLFARIEKRAPEPILAMEFFRIPAFRTANGAAFCSSFAIFSLSAFTPLYIQGVLGKSPATLGLAMIPLSLGWSLGALVCGQVIRPHRERRFSIWGALVLAGSTAMILPFTPGTPLWLCSAVLA